MLLVPISLFVSTILFGIALYTTNKSSKEDVYIVKEKIKNKGNISLIELKKILTESHHSPKMDIKEYDEKQIHGEMKHAGVKFYFTASVINDEDSQIISIHYKNSPPSKNIGTWAFIGAQSIVGVPLIVFIGSYFFGLIGGILGLAISLLSTAALSFAPIKAAKDAKDKIQTKLELASMNI
ncbi:hypothetical protein [Thalassospira profundimaris]|uniref:hypothetical protein n=1 Tax=Thalassospira profundimaris TaxID=502049 RepID=UPI0002871F44|nr:hypothetical protein [Thalassospira profundimaris]EKF09183.1 hypothetical protein TH2_04813 [Thalassospira profundimaris WP0211]